MVTVMPSMSAFVIDLTGVNWAPKNPLESFCTSYGTEAILFFGGGRGAVRFELYGDNALVPSLHTAGGHATWWPHGMSGKLTRAVPQTLVYT